MRIARPWPRKTMDDYTRRRLYLRVGQVIMVAGGIMAVVPLADAPGAFGRTASTVARPCRRVPDGHAAVGPRWCSR